MLVANRNGLVGAGKKIVLVGSRNESVLVGSRNKSVLVGSRNKIVLVGSRNKIALSGSGKKIAPIEHRNLLAHERVTESGHEEMMIEREMSEADKKESWAPPPGRTTCLVTELTRSMMRINHSIGLCMPFHCAVIMQKRTCVNGYMNQRLWLRSLACCVRKASNIVMLLLLTLMPCMVVSNAIEMLVGSWNLYALMWLLLRR